MKERLLYINFYLKISNTENVFDLRNIKIKINENTAYNDGYQYILFPMNVYCRYLWQKHYKNGPK